MYIYIYIYICMYGTTVTRGAAHTQYTVRIPKYSAQYRPHVVMFDMNIHCHVRVQASFNSRAARDTKNVPTSRFIFSRSSNNSEIG